LTGAGGLGSPGWFSPKSRVRYSDRFIPSRAATARLDFSALDREVVADQVNKSAQEREVGGAVGRRQAAGLWGSSIWFPVKQRQHLWALDILKFQLGLCLCGL
jgi:hypothetical protein